MRRKKTLRKKLEEKLDAIFSKVIRKAGFCLKCDTHEYERLQCSHIHTRSKLSTRWDLKNAFCLCGGCHLYWWHKNPIEAAEFAKDKLGEYEYYSLLKRANTPKKFTIDEMEELHRVLEDIYQGQ